MGLATAGVLLVAQAPAYAEDKPVYRCPGNLYTDALSAKEAAAKGCKTLDGAPITVIQSVIPKGGARAAPSGSGAGGEKVSSDDQKARDADRRKILEAELRKEEAVLHVLAKSMPCWTLEQTTCRRAPRNISQGRFLADPRTCSLNC